MIVFNTYLGFHYSPKDICPKVDVITQMEIKIAFYDVAVLNITHSVTCSSDNLFISSSWGCPRGVMVKAMDCGIVVREFVLQSRYYVHFRANTLGKGMNPLILPPAMDK